MAKGRPTKNGLGHNSGAETAPEPPAESAPEKPYFDRLVDLYRQMEALREDIKEVCIEAKEEDILIMPLKLAVRRYLETDRERTARLGKEEEAERMLRALGEFINTPLGEAAAEHIREPGENIGDL